MVMTRGGWGRSLVFGRTRLVGGLHLVARVAPQKPGQMSGWPRFQKLVS